jgi:hypothetical protein
VLEFNTEMKRRILIGLTYCAALAGLLWCWAGLAGPAQGMPIKPPPASGEAALVTSFEFFKWRQLGLMSNITGICDIAPNPSSNSLLAATYSSSGAEIIWRSDSDPIGERWARLLSVDTASDRVILELSRNFSSDGTICVAEPGADQIAISNDNGYSWRWQRAPGPVVAMAVEDKNTIYVALSEGYVVKSTDGARRWPQLVPSEIFGISMLALAGSETVLVGGKEGDVAYSDDGGASFTCIPKTVGGGNVQLAADASYAQNGIIYAGGGSAIYRWTIGTSSDWETIRLISPNQRISGLAVADGVLYGAWHSAVGAGSGVERCIEPTQPEVYLEYDTLAEGSGTARFDAIPNSLRASRTANGVRLWAVDTATPAILAYDDTLTRVVPALVSPASGTPVIMGTPVVFSIKAVTHATAYEVQLANNSDFTMGVKSLTITPPSVQTAPQSLSEGAVYWRARVSSPVRSPWSEVGTLGSLFTGVLDVPTPGAPNNQAAPISPVFSWSAVSHATGYELQLARDAGMTDLIADLNGAEALGKANSWECPTALEYGTNYFWRVRAVKDSGGIYSEWSSVVSFTTVTGAVAPTPPPVTPPAPEAQTIPMLPVPVTMGYLWVIIVIGIAAGVFLLVRQARRVSLRVLSSPLPRPAPKPLSVAPAPTVIAVTAEELCSAYNADNAAADAKYRGKALKVTGEVDSMGEDVLQNPYIRLSGGIKHQAWGVRCRLSKKPEPAQLTIGQRVTVQGKCQGRLMNVLMKDCSLIG